MGVGSAVVVGSAGVVGEGSAVVVRAAEVAGDGSAAVVGEASAASVGDGSTKALPVVQSGGVAVNETEIWAVLWRPVV